MESLREELAREYAELAEENAVLRDKVRDLETELERVVTSRWWKIHVKLNPLMMVAARMVPKRDSQEL